MTAERLNVLTLPGCLALALAGPADVAVVNLIAITTSLICWAIGAGRRPA